MKFLIVDDSKAMRMIIRRTLRQAGLEEHDVEEASNGTEALQVIARWNPDLVLADWNMPEMDGLELLRALRSQGNRVPSGFVTSDGTTDVRQTAESAGASFLIAKPFDADTFREVLGAVV